MRFFHSLIVFSLLFNSQGTIAKVYCYWLGATTFIISDGSTNLAFDAFITRYSVLDLATQKPLKTNSEIVEKWFKKINISSLDAVFINHSHYDHILDLPSYAQIGTPQIYLDTNGLIQARAQKIPEAQLNLQKVDDQHSVGKFKVTILESAHSPHLLGMTFMTGNNSKSFSKKPNLFDYKLKDSYAYMISHPEGNILVYPSSALPPSSRFIKQGEAQADVVIQGIASRSSSEFVLNEITSKVNPKILIPAHFDNFFKPLDEGITHLWGVDLEEFIHTVKKNYPNIQVIVPDLARKIILYP